MHLLTQYSWEGFISGCANENYFSGSILSLVAVGDAHPDKRLCVEIRRMICQPEIIGTQKNGHEIMMNSLLCYQGCRQINDFWKLSFMHTDSHFCIQCDVIYKTHFWYNSLCYLWRKLKLSALQFFAQKPVIFRKCGKLGRKCMRDRVVIKENRREREIFVLE